MFEPGRESCTKLAKIVTHVNQFYCNESHTVNGKVDKQCDVKYGFSEVYLSPKLL